MARRSLQGDGLSVAQRVFTRSSAGRLTEWAAGSHRLYPQRLTPPRFGDQVRNLVAQSVGLGHLTDRLPPPRTLCTVLIPFQWLLNSSSPALLNSVMPIVSVDPGSP